MTTAQLQTVRQEGEIPDTAETITEAPTDTERSMEELYSEAVSDAVAADADEVHDLVTVDPDSDMVTFDADSGKVLMLTFNDTLDVFIEDTEITCDFGEIWVFSDQEIIKWYRENKDAEITDWSLRFNQLIGVPPDSGYSAYVSAFWVDPSDLKRPAYETDVTKQIDSSDIRMQEDDELSDWFDRNIVWSYFDSAYPWTRLGYTYDWADNGTEYGLTEFIVLPDSVIDVEWTMTQEAFLAWLAEQTSV